MRKIAAFMCIVALMAGGAAEAAWSGGVKIESIEVSKPYAENPALVYLSFTTPPFASHTCPQKGGQYVLGGDPTNIDRMTSIATSALLNGRDVKVLWKGCNGYPVIVGITLL